MKRERRNYPTNKDAGYALVVTLLLIAIAGVAMGVVARKSLALASRAELDQSQLQHDWGTRSIQSTLLTSVLDVLASAEMQSETPLISYHTTIELNSTSFDLVFGDEQAKTNINTLINQYSELDTLKTLSDLIDDRQATQSLLIDPLPHTPATEEGLDALDKRPDRRDQASTKQTLPQLPPIGCFEQIWPEFQIERLINLDNLDQSWTAHLTLWGNGRVYFQRANAESIYRAVDGHLSRRDVLHLVALRNTTPALGIDRALHDSNPELERGTHRLIAKGLTEQSNCQSLWVITDSQRRTRYHLAVISNDTGRSTTSSTSKNPTVIRMDW